MKLYELKRGLREQLRKIEISEPLEKPVRGLRRLGRRVARRFKRVRHKNTLVATVLVFMAVGLCGSYIGAKYLLHRRNMAWRQAGIAASIAGDDARAASLLVRYLQHDPRDVEALSYYIKSRERAELPNGQHLEETIAAIKLLLGDDPSRTNDRRHLLELYVRLERRPEALDTADTLLAAHPNDVRTLELKTGLLTNMHQDHEALLSAEKWVAAAPMDLQAHLARLTLLERLGYPRDQILADAQKMRLAHPGDPRFELLQGFAFAHLGDKTEAARWLKTAAGHDPLSDDLAQTLVAQFDYLGMTQDSLQTLRRQVQQGGGPDLRHALGCRLWEAGQWNQAAAALADVNPRQPSTDVTLLALKAICLANAGKTAGASACRTALAARQTTSAAARAWDRVLRRVLDGAVIDDALTASICKAALALDRQNAYLAYYLGDSYARLGELDLAIGAWQESSTANPTWTVPAGRLVEALLQKGNPEEAFWVASNAAQHNPNSASTVIELARAWAAGVDAGGVASSDELFKYVTEIQRQLPGEDHTLLIELRLLVEQGKKPQAIDVARSAISRTPAPQEWFFLTFAALSRKYGFGLESECFARSEQAHGLTPALAYAQAADRFEAGDGKNGVASSGAADGLKQFDALASRGGKASTIPWRLARARYLDLVASPDARAAWKALADAMPNDLSVQQAAVSARTMQGDWDFMPAAIDRLHKLTGDTGLAWRVARARLLVESPRNSDDYEEGSVLLNQIIREYPGDSDAHVLLAHALVLMKRPDGAIEQLSLAARIDPTSVPIALQLAGLLQSRGDFDRVRQELDRLTPQLHSSAQREGAAMLLARQGSADAAARLLEQSPADPAIVGGAKTVDQQHSKDLLLAMIYRQQQEPDKVEPLLAKLLKTPDVPTVQFAASFYGSIGRPADAERALALLNHLKLEPGIADLVWGSYLAESGRLSNAVSHYAAATRAAPDNAVAWRVLAASQCALGRSSDVAATLAAAARALPADPGLAAAASHSALLRQAVDDPNLRDAAISAVRDPAHADAALELIRTLIDSRNDTDAQRIIARLTQLTERCPDYLPARVRLIKATLDIGRTSDAANLAQRLLTIFPNDPAAARIAAEVAAAAHQWQALAEAARLWKQRDATQAIAADTSLAVARIGLKEDEIALAELQPHLAAALNDPDRYAQLITTYCVALVHQNQLGSAEEILLPLATRSSPWRRRWVQVALEIPDGTPALQWMDHAARLAPPDALLDQVVVAEGYESLGVRLAQPRLFLRAAEKFNQITANPAAPAVALVSAASQAERHGHLVQAEALYRRAISMKDAPPVARNNLAMLIVARNGDLHEAQALATAAITAQPRSAIFQDTLAVIRAKTGHPRAAAASEAAAVQMDPDKPDWRVRLAQYQMEAGNVTEATQIIQVLDAAGLDMRSLTPADKTELQKIRKRSRLAKAE